MKRIDQNSIKLRKAVLMGHASIVNPTVDPEFNIPLTPRERAEYFMVTKYNDLFKVVNEFQLHPRVEMFLNRKFLETPKPTAEQLDAIVVKV